MTAATAPLPPARASDAVLPVPNLARTLLSLRFRLMRNRLRAERGKGRFAATAVASIALAFALSNAMIILSHAADPRIGRGSLLIFCLLVMLAWTIVPLLTFGVDESLDPTKLAQFPLGPTALVRGLLVASFAGMVPIAMVVVMLATVAGYGAGGAWLIGLPAMALLLALSAATSRAMIASLTALLRSRKGRDAAVMGTAVLILALQGLRFIHLGSVNPVVMQSISGVIRWVPPAMLGQSIIDARDGHWLLATGELLPSAACLWLVLRWWASALERSMTVVPGGQTSTRQASGREGLALMFRHLPFVPANRWGAVTARELRYASREPRRKISLFNSALIGLAGPVFLVIRYGGGRPGSVLLASLAGYILVLGAVNQFGFDRGALWLDAISGRAIRNALIGKNVAALIEVGPIVLVGGIALAALTGGWAYLPAALVLALAGMGAGFATGNIVSVRWPVRLPATNNPFASPGQGQGFKTGLLVIGSLVVQNLAVAPVAIAAAVAYHSAPVTLVAVAPICAAYGGVLYWVGLQIASDYGESHLPELLAKVDPMQSS